MTAYFLFQPQHYASSSSLKVQQSPDDFDDETSRDLEAALDESFKSILGEKEREAMKAKSADGSAVFRDQDFAPSLTPPAEKPPPPPPVADDAEVDKQEREIIASLEMEEREHKKYTMRKSSAAQGRHLLSIRHMILF